MSSGGNFFIRVKRISYHIKELKTSTFFYTFRFFFTFDELRIAKNSPLNYSGFKAVRSMYRLRLLVFVIYFLSAVQLQAAKLPQITPQIVSEKLHEIMKAHATYKELTPELVKRTLLNYLEELDPNKTYFIRSDIQKWLEPSDDLVNKVFNDFKQNNFSVFYEIHEEMTRAIKRRHELEKKMASLPLPKNVDIKEFKDMKWAENEDQLLDRLMRIRSLQEEASTKLSPDIRDKAFQRIAKKQIKYEEEILNDDPSQRERKVLVNVLKAAASALDTHTAYFTPDEATQFMIQVQQRLFGIGAQLRDDLNGFTVVKIIEGGPAAKGKQLKAKDRIIAVNGEPVVGMGIDEAVDLIRGEKGTPVTLTVIREGKDGEQPREEKLDIVVQRDEVVLKESRFSVAMEPFGNGVIGYLRLYSFYQDPNSSSTQDLTEEINKFKTQHNLKGLILDLRYNTGGLLSQAVDVAGLFITKGIVVSVKDHTGAVQHLRAVGGQMAWDGPLIVLINRSSASASEIVAQTLQDYGRAIIVGDDHSFGKGSFQTFTLNTGDNNNTVDPTGEYKVTRGRYYTVSGKTPQLIGVLSDIVIQGPLSETDIGERFAKYPLENDRIKPNYEDDLSDIPYSQRARFKSLYRFDLQQKLTTYVPFMSTLKKNEDYRMDYNKGYQAFLLELKSNKVDQEQNEGEETEQDELGGPKDYQLMDAYNIMKDLLYMQAVSK